MRRWLHVAATVGVLGLLACEPPPRDCELTIEDCVLENGCHGTRACLPDGSFGACGCSMADAASPDAGTRTSPDAGGVIADAGTRDAGTLTPDGSTPDAGISTPDASTPDAGISTPDASTPDAGASPPDAGLDGGSATIDGGPRLDAGVGDAGSPPVAQADSYDTFVDTPVRPAAPGVLANDLPAGRPLEAVLVAAPQHGSFSLSPSGGFSFIPAPGFLGVDTFTYRASDALGSSAPVTVTLTVRPSAVEHTLVVLVHHPEHTAPRPSVAEMQQRLATVAQLFREYSYNAVTLGGVTDPLGPADVIGWFQIPSTACLDMGAVFSAAAPAVDLVRYERVVVVLAQRPGCTLSANADLDRRAYSTPDGSAFFGVARLSLPNASPSTLTHELGHTFRNGHGRFLDCGAVSWAPAGCASIEYGDPYDVMSTGAGHPSARRKQLMGWFRPNSNRMLDVTDSGVFVVEPIESNTGGLKALAVPRGGEFPLTLEYRQPIGSDAQLDAGANVFSGLLLHAGDLLLDATPPPGAYGPLPPTDAQLTPVVPLGSSWTDPLTGNVVTVVGRSDAGLSVQVTLQ